MHLTRLIILIAVVTAIVSCRQNPPMVYPAGGYNYPVTVKDSNFYYYPLMDSFSRRDSFKMSLSYIAFKDFNEPNLSLQPMGEDIFRLRFESFKQRPVIISLTKRLITVKTGQEYLYQDADTNRLTPIEAFHFKILQHKYDLQNWAKKSKRRKYYDSLIHLYPQLTEGAYFKYLYIKSLVPRIHSYKYTTTKKHISYNTFYHIVSQLNAIGYWKMPAELPCRYDVSDGDVYSLEANTSKKYNIVEASSCNEQDDFAKVCQQIIKLAGLDDKIQLFNEPTIPQKPQEPVKVIEQDVILEDVKEPTKPKHN